MALRIPYRLVMRNTSRCHPGVHRPIHGRNDSNGHGRSGMRLVGVQRNPFRSQNPDTETDQDKLHDGTCAA